MGKPVNTEDADLFKSIETKGLNSHQKQENIKKEKVKVLVSTPEGRDSLMNFIFSGKNSDVKNPLAEEKKKKKQEIVEVPVEEELDEEELEMLKDEDSINESYEESIQDTLENINGDVDDNN